MRSRPSGTGRRSGYTRQGPRRPAPPQRRYREAARQAARRWAQCRPTKRPSAGDGRCSDPPRGVPHVGDICKGRLRPGLLQRINERKTRSASATSSSENLRKRGQREAAVKHGGYAAIRRIPRPRHGGGADPNQLHLHTTDDNTGKAGNHAAKSQISSDSSARQTEEAQKPKQTAGLTTR